MCFSLAHSFILVNKRSSLQGCELAHPLFFEGTAPSRSVSFERTSLHPSRCPKPLRPRPVVFSEGTGFLPLRIFPNRQEHTPGMTKKVHPGGHIPGRPEALPLEANPSL